MNPVVHFELPYENAERASAFYRAAFGWQTHLEKSMRAVRGAGGEVLGEPMEIPGVGRYVSFLDTERNRNSLLQPMREATP